jgi:hypothetical protein
LPDYQKRYSGKHYPSVEQQKPLQEKHYRYQPRDPLVRQQDRTPEARHPSDQPRNDMRTAPQKDGNESQRDRGSRPPPTTQPAHHEQPNGAERSQRPAPQRQVPPDRPEIQQSQPGSDQHRQPEARSHNQSGKPQDKGAGQEHKRGQGDGKDDNRDKPDERGQDRQR